MAVRDRVLLVGRLGHIRLTLPFKLRALDTGSGNEISNEILGQCRPTHGIELSRSRPWVTNDSAWVEQKNGSVVRRILGLRSFEELTAARSTGWLDAALCYYVSFFQTSFKAFVVFVPPIRAGIAFARAK